MAYYHYQLLNLTQNCVLLNNNLATNLLEYSPKICRPLNFAYSSCLYLICLLLRNRFRV